MNAPTLSPFLNVRSFACAEGRIQGEWPGNAIHGRGNPFERLAADACGADGLLMVRWGLQGEQRVQVGGEPSHWLHLTAEAKTTLVCQRCLAPAQVDIHAERSFRFVADEEAAAAEDDVSEEDVLVVQDALDWVQLLEDELIMSAPLVPMHGVCPSLAGAVQVEDEQPASERIRPFADLKTLLQRNGD